MINVLGFLAPIFGYIMRWIYMAVQNYGWAIILFTIAIRVIMFPLAVKQQKSTARMSAYNPYLMDIQKQYANDKQRQQEEVMKFQQEHNYSMTAGCLPMALNMLAIFGVIQVVYRPMQYILRVSSDAINAAIEVANAAGAELLATNYQVQNALIGLIKANPTAYADVLGDKLESVVNFNFNFLGIDLAVKPEFWPLSIAIIIPVLSVVTMLLSQVIMMKTSGQNDQMQGSMKIMMWVMPIMFAGFAFTVPIAFSLYYTISNILMLVQSLIVKQIYDPEKIKAQVAAEVAQKRAEKKKKKKVAVKDKETGKVVEKEVNEAELARIRLEKARELDEKKYEE